MKEYKVIKKLQHKSNPSARIVMKV